jgi:hypothetical protein
MELCYNYYDKLHQKYTADQYDRRKKYKEFK